MSDEEMSLRYARASEATAGTPSAATRAAIHREAELQAAARRAAGVLPPAAAPLIAMPPAANDSRWAMRAVASIAAVAVAAGLWWQLRPQQAALIESPSMVAANEVAPLTAPPMASADKASPPSAPAGKALSQSSQPPLAANQLQRRSTAAREAEGALPTHARQDQSVAVAAPGAVPGAVPGAAAGAAVSGAMKPAAADAVAAPDSALREELARRFPGAWNSRTPVAGLWVRMDAAGKIVAAGRHANGMNPQLTANAQLARDERTALSASSTPSARSAPPAASGSTTPSEKAEQPAAAPPGRGVEVINNRGVSLRVEILQ